MATERLRAAFVSHLDQGSSEASAAEAATLNLVLALILWQGVSSWSRLANILDGLSESEPMGRNGEGLVIPTQVPRFPDDRNPERSSEGLTGAVALAAVTAIPFRPEADREALERMVSNWMSSSCVKAPKGRTLDVLFAMVRIAHRFDAPPPLRLVWSGQVPALAMSVDRIRALFGHAPANHESNRSTEEETAPQSASRRSKLRNTGSADYDWLKAVLGAAKDRTKSFPDDASSESTSNFGSPEGETAKQKSATLPQRRKEACRLLHARLAGWPEDGSVVRALTAYAVDRLENGTPWSERIEARTVYKYVLSVGGSLLGCDPDLHLSDLDEEDLAELYAACILNAPPAFRAELSSDFAYFQDFLTSKGLAPKVMIGRSDGTVVALPDSGFVAPNEIAAALWRLRSELIEGDTSAGSNSEALASVALTALGFSAGARTSETTLRESRELVQDPGRRALIVRKNRMVSTKTSHSTRLVDLEPSMPASGWGAVEAWLKSSDSLRTPRESRHSALFSDTVDGHQPMQPERLTRRIAATLRAVTGRGNARVYWWRHTAVSNDVLAMFATQELLFAIQQGTDAVSADSKLTRCAD